MEIGTKNKVQCLLKNIFSKMSNGDIRDKFAALKSVQGFGLVSTLSMIPFLISAFFAVFAIKWWVEGKNEIQYLCENQILSLQKTLLDGENKLLAMNPIVDAMILRKEYLQVSLATAPTPLIKAAIAAKLALHIKNMQQLRSVQKISVLTTQQFAKLKSLQIYSNMNEKLKKLFGTWNTLGVTGQNLKNAKVELIEKFNDPLLPRYEAPSDFSQRQTLTWRSFIKTQSLFPKWIQNLTTKSFFWQETCYSYPQNQGGLWVAKLKTDKF